MSHILGVYYAPQHARPGDSAYIEALQPPVIRILDPDVQNLADMHRIAPGAIIAPRTWAIDDGSSKEQPNKQVRRLMADPVGTGRDHAEQYRGQWDRWQREARERNLKLPPVDRVLFNAANEPNQGGTPERVAEYNVAFLDRCTELGLRAAALCLGVGWPGNDGTPNNPPDWEPYAKAGLVDAIRRGDHVLELHEYFYKSGPQDGWRWLAGRHLWCPFDVPILLGEVGIDNLVDSKRWEQDGGNRGWVDHVGAEQYAAMITAHIRGSDRRVFAALPFLTDYRDGHEWWSFDTSGAHSALLARRHEMIPAAPHTVRIPAVVVAPSPDTTSTVQTGAPVQPDNWARAYPHVLHIEGGLSRDEKDVGNWYNGQLVGTKYGISAAVWGGQYDIPNLTRDQALDIYRQHYWHASGADALPWPMCLVHFDTAVNHGAGVARSLLQVAGDNVILYLARRLRLYTSLPTWPEHGAGWANRIAHLLQVVAER